MGVEICSSCIFLAIWRCHVNSSLVTMAFFLFGPSEEGVDSEPQKQELTEKNQVCWRVCRQVPGARVRRSGSHHWDTLDNLQSHVARACAEEEILTWNDHKTGDSPSHGTKAPGHDQNLKVRFISEARVHHSGRSCVKITSSHFYKSLEPDHKYLKSTNQNLSRKHFHMPGCSP